MWLNYGLLGSKLLRSLAAINFVRHSMERGPKEDISGLKSQQYGLGRGKSKPFPNVSNTLLARQTPHQIAHITLAKNDPKTNVGSFILIRSAERHGSWNSMSKLALVFMIKSRVLFSAVCSCYSKYSTGCPIWLGMTPKTCCASMRRRNLSLPLLFLRTGNTFVSDSISFMLHILLAKSN